MWLDGCERTTRLSSRETSHTWGQVVAGRMKGGHTGRAAGLGNGPWHPGLGQGRVTLAIPLRPLMKLGHACDEGSSRAPPTGRRASKSPREKGAPVQRTHSRTVASRTFPTVGLGHLCPQAVDTAIKQKAF